MASVKYREQLRQFRESRAVLGMQQIGRERLDALMPLLLRELWQQPQPVITLQRVMPLLEAVVRRTALSGVAERKPAGADATAETLRRLQLGGRLHCPDPIAAG